MSLLKKIQGAKYKKQNKLFVFLNRLFYVSNTLEKIGSTNKMFVIFYFLKGVLKKGYHQLS